MGPFQLECIAAGGDRAVLRITGLTDAFALHSCVLEAVTADPNWQAAVSAGGLSAGIWCREHGLL